MRRRGLHPLLLEAEGRPGASRLIATDASGAQKGTSSWHAMFLLEKPNFAGFGGGGGQCGVQGFGGEAANAAYREGVKGRVRVYDNWTF